MGPVIRAPLPTKGVLFCLFFVTPQGRFTYTAAETLPDYRIVRKSLERFRSKFLPLTSKIFKRLATSRIK
ncbi:hypothetical protein GQ55_2G225600 [Panicum hallii var. hallii]|uniref:Uncharacterized protein n=1 Tax=Panicum hallii var. hallii TaxID=1504633 RepID=A0A2T7ERB5_9POAL|nr:hypothetical protein GQ55_2G225600 [Panicum hallii var. hallii]